MRDPKILWHSNAGYAPTGYGNQTGLFAPALRQSGFDIACSAYYGLEGSRIVWEGVPVFPCLGGEFGGDYIGLHAAKHFGDEDPTGGLVMTLMDVWVLNAASIRPLNTACWVPIDHDPAPPDVVRFFAESGAIPIAMSLFGEEKLREAGLDPLYVPHAVDTDAFKPQDYNEVRQIVGVPDGAFLVGMVAANKGRPSRKGFVQALQAFAQLRERHDNAYLYLHTSMNPNLTQGEALDAVIQSLEIPPGAVMIGDQYRMMFDPYPPETMSKIYSAMDVLLNPALGEGFGITPLEAQACGVPVIVTDFSAMPQVCGSGWSVPPMRYGYWTGQRSWMANPDVDGIVDALEQCYALTDTERQAYKERARAHALEYSLPKVLEEHMIPAIEAAWERSQERQPSTVMPTVTLNRAERRRLERQAARDAKKAAA